MHARSLQTVCGVLLFTAFAFPAASDGMNKGFSAGNMATHDNMESGAYNDSAADDRQ